MGRVFSSISGQAGVIFRALGRQNR